MLGKHPLLDTFANCVEELFGHRSDLGLHGRKTDKNFVEDNAETALNEGRYLPSQLLENFKCVKGYLHVWIIYLLAKNVNNTTAWFVLKEFFIILETNLRNLSHALESYLPVTALASLEIRIKLIKLRGKFNYFVLLFPPRKLLLRLRLGYLDFRFFLNNQRVFHGLNRQLWGRQYWFFSFLKFIAMLQRNKLHDLSSSLTHDDVVQ